MTIPGDACYASAVRHKATKELAELLKEIQALKGRRRGRPAVQRAVEDLLGPLVGEVTVLGPYEDGNLVIACRSPSARERAAALEGMIRAAVADLDGCTVRRVVYRIDHRAGRSLVPERLTRQLRPVSNERREMIDAVASGLRDENLRRHFAAWMTTVAQLEDEES